MRDMPYIAQKLAGVAFNFPTIINWLSPEMQISLKADSAASLLKIMEDRSYASAEPIGEAKEQGGAPYYSPAGQPHLTHGEANEPAKAKELWEDSVDSLGISREKAL